MACPLSLHALELFQVWYNRLFDSSTSPMRSKDVMWNPSTQKLLAPSSIHHAAQTEINFPKIWLCWWLSIYPAIWDPNFIPSNIRTHVGDGYWRKMLYHVQQLNSYCKHSNPDPANVQIVILLLHCRFSQIKSEFSFPQTIFHVYFLLSWYDLLIRPCALHCLLAFLKLSVETTYKN